ncbi:MAG: hypothetical protein D4R44_00830 [Actinobacteria bacterium]|nr:MAG: hypothetical protein D4R44_00830 [Actinomycetota bacterium]
MEFNIAWVCAAVVGVVFIFAGIQKLLAGIEWLVQAKQLRPPRIAQPLVPLVPYIELVVGGLLIGGWWEMPVRTVAIGLLTSFTVLLTARLAAGERPPCACFSFRSSRPISWSNVTRNCGLLALLVASIV